MDFCSVFQKIDLAIKIRKNLYSTTGSLVNFVLSDFCVFLMDRIIDHMKDQYLLYQTVGCTIMAFFLEPEQFLPCQSFSITSDRTDMSCKTQVGQAKYTFRKYFAQYRVAKSYAILAIC